MKSLLKTLLNKFHFQREIRRLNNYKRIQTLTLLSFMWAILTGSKNGYFLWAFIVMVKVVSLLILKHNVKNFNYYFYIRNKEIVVGDLVEFSYDLVNNSLIPISYIEIQLELSKDLLHETGFDSEYYYFKGSQMLNCKHEVKCIRRGHYQIGRMHGRLRDPLAMFEVDKYFDRSIDLLVFPKIYRIENMKISPFDIFGSIKMLSPVYEDYTNIKDIRDYRNGDNFKHIHWKLSAKKDKLQTKEFQLNANQKIQLIINGDSNSYINDKNNSIEETIVSIAASITKYSLDNSIEINLGSNNSKNNLGINRTGKSISVMNNFLLDFIYFAPSSFLKLENYINKQSRKWHIGTSVIIITPLITDDLISEIMSLKKKKMKLLVILVTDDVKKEENLNKYVSTQDLNIVNVTPSSVNELWEVI